MVTHSHGTAQAETSPRPSPQRSEDPFEKLATSNRTQMGVCTAYMVLGCAMVGPELADVTDTGA